MRQLVIKEMDCPYVSMAIGPLLALEQLLLYVEDFRHLVLFILVIILPINLEDLEVTHLSVWVFRISANILMQKIQGWYTVCSDGCGVEEYKTIIIPYLRDASTITSWVKKMVLSLRDNIIVIKFWFCVTISLTGLLIRTVIVILCPWIQCILSHLIIFGNLGTLVTFRR